METIKFSPKKQFCLQHVDHPVILTSGGTYLIAVTKSSEVGNSESCYEIGERSAHSLAVTQSSEMNSDMPIEAVAIEETTNTEQQEFSDNICAIDERSAHSVAATQSSGSHISIPIEKVSSLELHESAEAVATEETTNTSEQTISEHTDAINERSASSVAVTQSSGSHISIPIEKVSSLQLHESAEAVATEETSNTSEQTISEHTDAINERSASSVAVTQSSGSHISIPIEKVSSLQLHESAEAVATEETTNTSEQTISEHTDAIDERSAHSVAATQSSGSHISIPIEKVSSLELHESAEAVATEEAMNTGEQTISEYSDAINERSAHSVAVTQSSGSHISIPIEKVSSLELHESAEAVATEETMNTGEQTISEYSDAINERSAHSVAVTQSSDSHITTPIEKVSSLELHESAEAVATEETTNTEQQEINEYASAVDERSAHSVAVTQSIGSHVSIPIEKVSSLQIHDSAKAEIMNSGEQTISEYADVIDERSAHSLAVTQSSGSHISVPIEKVSSLELHESAEAVATEETTNTEQQEISEYSRDVDERSAHSVAVTQSSGSHIGIPIEKVSSLQRHESAEAVATEETTNTEQQEISEYSRDVDERSAHSVAVTQSSGSHISIPISSLQLHESAEAVATEETTNTEQQEISEYSRDVDERSAHSVAVAQSSGSHISIPIEKVSSLELRKSAESVATEETTNTEQQEIVECTFAMDERSSHSVAVTQSSESCTEMPIEKLSSQDVKESAADNSMRQRKRKRSSEKCMDEILQLNNGCSVTAQQSEDLVEPLQKYRRLCNIEELTVAGDDKDEPGIDSVEAVATEETTNTEQQEISDNTLVDERSAHSVAVTQSSGSHISVPIEKVSSLELHASAEAVVTEETTNTEQQEISDNALVDERSAHSVAVTQTSGSHISIPIEKVSSLELHASAEAVVTEETTNTEQQEISDNTLVDERSAHSIAVTQSSGSHISIPIEKVSSLELHASVEAVVTEETTNTEQQEISDNALVDESSAHSVAVAQSSGSHISVPIEKVSSLELHASAEAVVTEETTNTEQSSGSHVSVPIEKISSLELHESAEAVATEETTNTEQQEISENAIVDGRSAHSVAVTQSSGSHISVPIEKVSSLELHESAEAVVTEETTNTEQQEIIENVFVDGRSAHSVAVTQSSGSLISVPIEKVSSLELHASAEAVSTEETTNTEQQEISEKSLGDGRSAHSVAVTQSSGSHISIPIEKVSSLELHVSAEVVVTEETTNTEQSSGSHISVPIEKVSSLELHESAEAVATEETPNTEQQEISENAIVDERSAHLVAVTQSSGSHMYISIPIEKVSSLELHESAEAVSTEETTNTEQQEISENALVDGRSAHSVAVAQSSGSHISIPIEKVSSLELHASAEAVVTEETTNTEQSSGSHISIPIEKVSSLELHESAEAVATEETTNTEQQEISENAIVDERSAHLVAVTQSSGSHMFISIPIEKVSSLELHESAEAVATEETTNTEQQGIDECTFAMDERSAHSVAVTQSSESRTKMCIEKLSSQDVKESAADNSIRQRKRKRSSEKCMEEILQLNNSCSVTAQQSEDLVEPLQKYRRLCNIEELTVAGDDKDEPGIEVSCKLSGEFNESAEGVATEETTNTSYLCDVDEGIAHSIAVTQSSEKNIDMPIDNVSAYDVPKSAEAVAKEETNMEEWKISESSHIHELSAHSVAVTQSSEAHINMPIKKDSVLDLLKLSDAAATEESTDLSESKANECMSDAASCTEHVMTVTQTCGAYTSMPIEELSSVYVHDAVEPVPEKTTVIAENNISEYTEDSMLDVDGPTEAVNQRKRKRSSEMFVGESEEQSDDLIEPLRKSSRQCKVKESAVPAPVNHQMCADEGVEDSSHQPRSGQVSGSLMLPCDMPANSEEMALNSVQNALEMCTKIKTEDLPVSVGAPPSDVDTPDTMGYVHYYLRTAYQLLFGAMVQDPVNSTPLESNIQHSQVRMEIV